MKKLMMLFVIAFAMAAVFAGCGDEEDEITENEEPGSCAPESYVVNMKLDSDEKILTGSVIITFQNNTNETLEQLCIRNCTEFIPLPVEEEEPEEIDEETQAALEESTLGGKDDEEDEQNPDEEVVEEEPEEPSSITAVLMAEKGKKLEHTVSEDGSVMYVDITKYSLDPGKSISIEVDFETYIPKGSGHFGYKVSGDDETYKLSCCFPTGSVYDEGQWDERSIEDSYDETKDESVSYTITLELPKGYSAEANGTVDQDGNVVYIKARNAGEAAIKVVNAVAEEE